jgi:hypothetical protein
LVVEVGDVQVVFQLVMVGHAGVANGSGPSVILVLGTSGGSACSVWRAMIAMVQRWRTCSLVGAVELALSVVVVRRRSGFGTR